MLRLSYSAVSTYEKCPLSYRFQYIEKIEVKPTPYLSFGKSLHSALEWLYDRQTPQPPALEELLSFLESCWASEGFSDQGEEDSYFKQARDVLTSFYHANTKDFRLPLAVEHRFELKMEDFILSGVIDRVDRHPNGAYEIIDYKTSRRLPQIKYLREDLQLPIYQLACREVWGISPAKLTYYYLLPNQRYSTQPLDEEGLSKVKGRLDTAASSIRDEEFPALPNRLCPWCSYQDICPVKADGDDQEERYRSRHLSLIRRREKLDGLIGDLEEEMRQMGISREPAQGLDGHDDP